MTQLRITLTQATTDELKQLSIDTGISQTKLKELLSFAIQDRDLLAHVKGVMARKLMGTGPSPFQVEAKPDLPTPSPDPVQRAPSRKIAGEV